MKLSMLSTRTWEGHVMGTEARLAVVTDDRGAGHAALVRAVEDLEDTEKALSRFWRHSDLSRLNRSRTTIADDRLLTAIETAIEAYEWSDGLLDPRVIAPLERFGYRDGVPRDDVGEVEAADPLPPADMRAWIGPGGMVSLPDGVRMDLAGVGKALGIGWAALCLAGHAGLLVDVGGDVVALGVVDEGGEPWRVLAMHEAPVGEFSGSSLAVATSTTRKRSWRSGGEEAHHIIDPRTGAPSRGELDYATVAAPTILEADLAAKLLILEGKCAFERFGERHRAVVTDRRGRTEVLA